MKNEKKPTAAELEILDVLWEKKSATVREVFEIINERKPVAYTTVLKLMQIMFEKDLVKRDESGKAHIYRAKQPQKQMQTNLVLDLLEKVFRGSALKLVQHVLETESASAEELKKIKQLIKEAEKNTK